MLQHNVYSRRGWLEVRALLFKFVHEGWTPAMARRASRVEVDSGRRGWSFTKGAKLAGVEGVRWSFTIADIRLDAGEHYCDDVRRWAETILSDSEHLVRGTGQVVEP
jgi:hypothetical protein